MVGSRPGFLIVALAGMMIDSFDCFTKYDVAYDRAIKVTKMGRVSLQASVDGVIHFITLRDVYYAQDLTQNLLSYCYLEEKGVALSY